jgi:hypothetical protein
LQGSEDDLQQLECLSFWTYPSSGIYQAIKEHNVSAAGFFPSSGVGQVHLRTGTEPVPETSCSLTA